MSHARFAPSSAARWIACPGSVLAQEALGEKEDTGSPASRKGTSAHNLLETCIILGERPEVFYGYDLEPGFPVVDQSMIDGVNVALDWVDEYVEDYGRDNVIVIPERRVMIGPMLGLEEEECNGTSDLMIAHKDFSRLTTADYKNGQIAVDVEDNPQLMMYTAGAVYELRKQFPGKKFKSFRSVVIQPNAAKKRAVDSCDYKQAKLTLFLKKAEHSAAIAKMPGAPRAAGKHCNFCRAMDNCQTYRTRARAVAADEFDEILDPEEIDASKIEEILKEADLLLGWIKAVKSRALKMATAGVKFDDYELGFGRRTKAFENIEEVAAWCESKGIPRDVYMPRHILTPAQLDAELKRAGLFPKKKRGDVAKPQSPLERFISYSVPSPVLKPKGVPDAEDDFDAV